MSRPSTPGLDPRRGVLVARVAPADWLAHTDYETSCGVLSSEEQARAARFHRDADRELYVAAHAFWRFTLGDLLGEPPESLLFATGEHGRPALLNGFAADFDTNLSHTNGQVAFALARGPRVGVDVEDVDRDLDPGELAPRVFAPEEIAWMDAAPDGAERRDRFFRLWTVKESYSKALGIGFGIDFAAHWFVHEPEGGWRIARRAPSNPDRSPWTFHEERLPTGHRLAACADRTVTEWVKVLGSG